MVEKTQVQATLPPDESSADVQLPAPVQAETVLRSYDRGSRVIAGLVGLEDKPEKYGSAESRKNQDTESNYNLLKPVLGALTSEERHRSLSKYRAVNALSRLRIQELSRIGSSSVLYTWNETYKRLGKNFAPQVPEMWQRESGKPHIQEVINPTTEQPEQILVQDDILNPEMNSDNSSFVAAYRPKEVAETRDTVDTILAEKVADINPYYLIAEIALQSLKVLVGARNQAQNYAVPHPELGVTQVALPVRDFYYVVIHANDKFCKVKLPFDVIRQNDASQLYELIIAQTKVGNGKDPWVAFDTKGLQAKAYGGKITTQMTYQADPERSDGLSPRENPHDPTAADLSFVLTDESRTSLDFTQNAVTSLTYGPSIPNTFRIGLEKIGGRYNLKRIATKSAHAIHDAAPVNKMMAFVLATAMKQTAARKQEYSSKLSDFQDIRLESDLPTRELVQGEEAPVGEVTVGAQQERVDRIHQKIKTDAEARAAMQLDKVIDHRSMHNLLTVAIMAAKGIQDAHFVETETRHNGLSPAMVTMPRFLIKALTREDDRPLTKRELVVLEKTLKKMSERRMECKRSRGIMQVLAVCSGGLVDPNSRKIIEFLGKRTDKFRSRLVTDTTTISMLVAGSDTDYDHDGLVNDGFTSALDKAHKASFGLFRVGKDKIKISYRTKKMSDALDEEAFEKLFNRAYGRMLDAYDPEGKTPKSP